MNALHTIPAMSMLDLHIARLEKQADSIVVLDLCRPDGGPLPPFEAGAHVDLHLADGFVRQYSLCGAPSDRSRYRIGVLLDPNTRGGSQRVHRDLLPGGAVRVGLPRNLFPLAPDAAQSFLIGGGIGITPILAMAHQLDAAGQDFALHYCARTRGSAAFLGELADSAFVDRVSLHFDDEGEQDRFSVERALPPPKPGAHLYVCGPTGFMDWVIADAKRAGYVDAQIHREYFSAEIDTAGDAFEIVLANSNRVVAVPEGKSIVAALAEIGTKIDVSCEQGVCGTCLCTVLDGIPDHRDTYLTDEEKEACDQMLLCCSRSKTPRLVLDL